MNTGTSNFVRLFENQKHIRILFIILNVLAWFADDSEENALLGEKHDGKLSENLYIFIIIVSILVNIYYLTTNQEQLDASIRENKNIKNFELRRIAIILVIVSLVLFLYVELNDSEISLDESIII